MSFGPFPNDPGLGSGALPEVTLESLGAIGDGITDDSVAFQKAANLGPARISGTHKSYAVNATINMASAQGQYWDMWGITINSTLTTGPIFSDNTSDGVTFKAVFTWAGGKLVGSGTAGGANSRSAFLFRQWSDLRFIGIEVTAFADSGIRLLNCKRVWEMFNYVHDCCQGGGHNAIAYDDATPVGLNNIGQFYFMGNLVGGTIPTDAIGLISVNGTTVPFSAVIAYNILQSNAQVVSGEIATAAGPTESFMTDVEVIGNVLTITTTGTTSVCVFVQDDGASPTNDPNKISHWRIKDNIMTSAANGTANGVVHFYGSNSQIDGNDITSTGTSGCCIDVRPNTGNADPTVVTNVRITNNDCYQTNTGGTQTAIHLFAGTQVSIADNNVYCSSTVQATANDGIGVESGCTHISIANNLIWTPGRSGIAVLGMSDCEITDNKVFNANAANNAAGNAFGIGVLAPAPSGTENVIKGNRLVDNRGTHQMLNAVGNFQTTGTLPELINNVMKGAKNAIVNNIANFSYVSGNRTDQPNTFPAAPSQPAIQASGVASTAQPYGQWIHLTGGTGTLVSKTRSGGAALTFVNQAAGPVTCSFFVDAGDVWTPTYTVAPTLTIWPVP